MDTLAQFETYLEGAGWVRSQPSPDENPLWSHPLWLDPNEERVTTGEALAMEALTGGVML